MAREKKPKTKKSVMNTLCTENETGAWDWAVQAMQWRWRPGIGLNTFLLSAAGEPKPVGYFKTLDQAVTYAWGFVTGFNAATRDKLAPGRSSGEEE